MGSGDRDDDALAPTATPQGALDETTPASTTADDPRRATPIPKGIGPGARVGRLVLGELLGAGGMGVVHRAHDPELDRAVAVKLVRARLGGSSGKARLVREAQAMAKLRHPNVVAIFDVGTVGDDVYVVMPLLEGGTLGAWARAAPRPWREVVDRYLAAGRGLAAAHAADLVHRDFKPDNVLLGADGEVQVADFGLARVDRDEVAPKAMARMSPPLSLDLTRTGDVLGTPAYMAPEQMRGEEVDARADQFSFCVALWEGVFGVRPFAKHDAIAAGRVEPPAAGHDAPAWLRSILLRGLRADPAERWPSMQALLDAIVARRHPARGRLPLFAALGAAVIVAGVAIAVLARGESQPLAFQRHEAPGPPRFREERLTRRGDVMNGSLSPDGTQLALVAGDRVIVLAVDGEAAERTVHRVTGDDWVGSLAWSPDGRRLALTLNGTQAMARGGGNTELVDVATGEITAVPVVGSSIAFLSDDTIAYVEQLAKRLSVRTLDPAATPATCTIDASYDWLLGVDAVDGGRAMVVHTSSRESVHQLLVVEPDCRIRATLPLSRGVQTFAVPSHGRSVLVRPDDSYDLVELSLDGAEIARSPLEGGGPRHLLGAHDGRIYEILRSESATVERVELGGERRVELSSETAILVAVAPDRKTVAWIERSTNSFGPLRIARLDQIAERGRPVFTDALQAAWHPDGTRLAVARGGGFEILDPSTGASTPIAAGELGPFHEPVWIDERRLATSSADFRTYEWVDTTTGETGQLVDPQLGWIFSVTRRADGMLAAGWNRPPGADIYTFRPGEDAVSSSARAIGFEVPFWSASGELMLYEAMSGAIERVEAGGKRTAVVRLSLLPEQRMAGVVDLGGEYLVTLFRTIGDVTVSIPE